MDRDASFWTAGRPVAVHPHAGPAVEVGLPQAITCRVTPDTDGNSGKGCGAHELARLIVSGGHARIGPHLNRGAEHRSGHLARTERAGGVAADEHTDEVGAAGDRVDHDVRADLLGKPQCRGL